MPPYVRRGAHGDQRGGLLPDAGGAGGGPGRASYVGGAGDQRTRGSGTVFFSGCTLGCVFCQNHEISAQGVGKPVTVERLGEIFRELIRQGAHNINLVTPGHFAPWVARALEPSLPVPVVCNTGGYERVETLRLLEGKVQVYLPDMKYALEEPARQLSGAGNYPAAPGPPSGRCSARWGPGKYGRASWSGEC